MSELVKGKIKKILLQKDDDWGRYVIDQYGNEILAVGVIPQPFIGMNLTISGGEVTNKYGTQFKIDKVIAQEEDKLGGVRKFLTDGYIKGIGSTRALAILNMYGKESIDLFDTEEGREKLEKVKGLAKATVKAAYRSYVHNKKYKDIVIFMNGAGTKAQVKSIYKKYGDNTISVLKENPYKLQTDLDGFGFKKTDKIALGAGIKYNSVVRIMAGLYYLLEKASMDNGNCYLGREELREEIGKILVECPKTDEKKITETVIENVLKDTENNLKTFKERYKPSTELINSIKYVSDARKDIKENFDEALNQALSEGILVEYNNCIYTDKMFTVESNAGNTIRNMVSDIPVRRISDEIIEKAVKDVEERKTKKFAEEGKDKIFEVTEEQIEAVKMAANNRFCIISGGPGRGKTAISEIVAHAFCLAGFEYDKEDIVMLATTGRAAQRITEATGYEAKTVHRAILAPERPHRKLVLIDEVSMMDIFLLYKVLKYASDCNVILVGDVYQIPSVGPGKILKDLIDSGVVPYVILEKGHRNTGAIARNSEKINSGMRLDTYEYNSKFVYVPYKVYSEEYLSPEQIVEGKMPTDTSGLLNIVTNKYIEKANEYGIKNVMLCTAMVERGNLSVNKLNRRLQELFTKGNKEAYFGEKGFFRVGDRVMQTKNDYDFLLKDKDGIKRGVFNGERGTVANITKDDEGYKMVVLFDDGSLGGYTSRTAGNLSLAYASTVHKCQGSEAPCVIMVYTYADYMLLNRSLYYTGETRAKKEFIMYGEEQYRHGNWLSAFDIAVKKTEELTRNTNLKEFVI